VDQHCFTRDVTKATKESIFGRFTYTFKPDRTTTSTKGRVPLSQYEALIRTSAPESIDLFLSYPDVVFRSVLLHCQSYTPLFCQMFLDVIIQRGCGRSWRGVGALMHNEQKTSKPIRADSHESALFTYLFTLHHFHKDILRNMHLPSLQCFCLSLFLFFSKLHLSGNVPSIKMSSHILPN
jgi:hypothetical protein